MLAGISFSEVDRMTAKDVAFVVNVHREHNKEIAQITAQIAYNCAILIGIAVNDPRKLPQIEDAFPNLFERREQQVWRVMKERIAEHSKPKIVI